MEGDDHGVALVGVEAQGTHETIGQAVMDLGFVSVHPFARRLSKSRVGRHDEERDKQQGT